MSKPLLTIVATVALLGAGAAARAVASDGIALRSLPASLADAPARVSKYVYLFEKPAAWSGVLAWRYNPSGAPAAFADPTVAVAAIAAALDKWTASCGVRYLYEGTTTSRPNATVVARAGEAPDGDNVVGWGELAAGTAGITHVWHQDTGRDTSVLIDSDITLSPSWVTSADAMERVAAHEWGHAIGVEHSNLDAALMSGPPLSSYSRLPSLEDDDLSACRCLYGPATREAAGFLCGLPARLSFGTLPVGGSATQRVVLTNHGNAPLAIHSIDADRASFGTAGCDTGTLLLAGESCALTVTARALAAGNTTAMLSIRTSGSTYRVPLSSDASAAPAAVANHQGLWWNAPAGSESGWGLNIAHQGDTLFATWFTYDRTGKGWWLSMTAERTGIATYEGDIVETRGPWLGATTFDPAAVTRTAVGRAKLTFEGSDSARFFYSLAGVAQAKTIVRQAWNPLPTCTFGDSDAVSATNYQDVWWAAPAGSESGWGIHLTHQGDIVFGTLFTYGADGSPRWLYVTANRIAGERTYSGTLYTTTGPPFDSAPFVSARVASTPVGIATLSFTNGNDATFAYDVDGVKGTKPITRQVFRAPGTVCR